MVVNEAFKYHRSAPDVFCITVKYIYQNANDYLANTWMLPLIKYCWNCCTFNVTEYLVAHCLVYSTGVFQYQSVLAPVRCRPLPVQCNTIMIPQCNISAMPRDTSAIPLWYKCNTSAMPCQGNHLASLFSTFLMYVHFLIVTMAQILRPQYSSFGVILGKSDQNELYHTPLSKIWYFRR